MKIALAQISSIAGDVTANIARHETFIRQAAVHQSDLILFPELSLSAYEPSLIRSVAMEADAPGLDTFQSLSEQHRMTICIGIPLKNPEGITISLLIFQPDQGRQIYSKNYLHADEVPYFVRGRNTLLTMRQHPKLAPAICYEISVPEHAGSASRAGASVYLASVVKYGSALPDAFKRLSTIARSYRMTVFMANAVGEADGGIAGGCSSVWTPDGDLAGQLGPEEEGLLVYDTTLKQIHHLNSNEMPPDRT
jgi:predicted amidohydrolase